MLSIVLFIQGVSIAVYDANGRNFDAVSDGGMITYGVAHTFIVPLFIIILFDIVYLLHKSRSVNFCCLSFDAGHRNLSFRSSLMRFAIWIVAFATWAFSTIIYCIGLLNNDKVDRESTLEHRFCTRSIREALERADNEDNKDENLKLLIYYGDLVPYFAAVTFTLYFGVLLWRYGTSYSIKVNATIFNPWGACLAASIIFMIAMALKDGAEIVTDVGYLVLNVAIVWMVGETDSEIERGDKVKSYLSHKRAILEMNASSITNSNNNINGGGTTAKKNNKAVAAV